MGLNLIINGSLSLTILDIVTKKALNQVKGGKEIEEGVFDNLQQGEYVISLAKKEIFDINNLVKPLYSFDFEVNEETEYEFEDL